jgi:DNA-binding transcriptional regulator YiaG
MDNEGCGLSKLEDVLPATASKDLRTARKAAGLSMRQAATLSNTPYRTWQSWEDEGRNGRRPPGIAFEWLKLWRLTNG